MKAAFHPSPLPSAVESDAKPLIPSYFLFYLFLFFRIEVSQLPSSKIVKKLPLFPFLPT